MKNLKLQISSFPSHRSVIEFSIPGRGKSAYLRVGVTNIDDHKETVAGAIDNCARLRDFLVKAMKRLSK